MIKAKLVSPKHHGIHVYGNHILWSSPIASNKVMHSGRLRHGIQFSRNRNVKLTWVPEVGVIVKCKWCIVAFYVIYMLCNYIIVKSWWMNSPACKLYVGRRSVLFSGWVLQVQVTFVLCNGDCAHENCLCRGGAEEHQTKQLDMAWRIAYRQ